MSIICLQYDKLRKIHVFYKFLWRWLQVYHEFKEYEKRNPISKCLRSWILCSKPNPTMCFWASLFMISFEDLNLIVYIWVFNTTIEVTVKKEFNSNNTLLLLLGLWPPEKMVLVYHGIILVHFTMLAPC